MKYCLNKSNKVGKWILSSVVASGITLSSAVLAQTDVTLIQFTDLHGNMVPHAGRIEEPDGTMRVVTQGGGIAKMATVVNEIRADNPNSLLLVTGDATHGSAETLFTMGDAIMPALNALGIDAYTPGNWDFGYGPAVFRNRFAPSPPYPPLPANNRVMVDSDGVPGVTKANFDSVTANLYNDAPLPRAAPFWGKRVFNPYKIFTLNGVDGQSATIAVIGLTSSIVPQQPTVFSRTFRFTQGIVELPGLIEEVKAAGADVIVVQSELGLSQNVQIGREFPDVDVVLSAHTHELTLGAILAYPEGYEIVDAVAGPTPQQITRLQQDGALVVETGEDLYIGRMDLTVNGGGIITSFTWEAIPVDDDVAEDPTVAALVMEQEERFIAGEDGKVQRHTFMPGGFCPGNDCGDITKRGHQLIDDLNMVVGTTDVLLHRHHVLETEMNNFIADAFRTVMNDPAIGAREGWTGVDISATNGFRFDTEVLPASMVPEGATFWDGRQPGEITLRDLYSYMPIAPALVAADFNGFVLEENLNNILQNVFSTNPYVQRGGWYLGLSSNISQMIDVVNRPFSTSSSRIVDTTISGAPIDHSKRYVMASCYGHTFALGRVCRAEGGANSVFFTLTNPDDYSSPIGTAEPVNTTGIINNRHGGPIKQVAPDNFMHPVHALRVYLDSLPNNTIAAGQYATGRVVTVDSTTPNNDPLPLPEGPFRELIQPIDGSGPSFLDREVFVTK